VVAVIAVVGGGAVAGDLVLVSTSDRAVVGVAAGVGDQEWPLNSGLSHNKLAKRRGFASFFMPGRLDDCVFSYRWGYCSQHAFQLRDPAEQVSLAGDQP
jgi:hypothetical protein